MFRDDLSEWADKTLVSLEPQTREAFLAHLRGGTSAAWLADWLRRAGVQGVDVETLRQARTLR